MDYLSQVIKNNKGASCVLRSITVISHGAVAGDKVQLRNGVAGTRRQLT